MSTISNVPHRTYGLRAFSIFPYFHKDFDEILDKKLTNFGSPFKGKSRCLLLKSKLWLVLLLYVIMDVLYLIKQLLFD